jgi:lipoyl(octanoyl) transferase
LSETWRLLIDGEQSGARNMGVDEALLDAVNDGASIPVLRLYAWQPACLSLGYAQRSRDVDRERLAARGWHVVRRMTGGRAILHTDELTYSVTLPLTHPLAAGGIIESYKRLSAALLSAVIQTGAAVSADRHDKRQGQRPGPVCFEVPSDYEITAGGKKLIGSAQVRRKNAMLQHGSIPLTGDISRICDVLAFPDEQTRAENRRHVSERATTLSDALGRQIAWDEAANALIDAFRATFDIQLEQSGLTTEEAANAAAHTACYAADEWTLRV